MLRRANQSAFVPEAFPYAAMATLTWADVVIVGLVAFVGFTLVSYWLSAWMARRNISGQVKGKPPKPKGAQQASPPPAAPRAKA